MSDCQFIPFQDLTPATMEEMALLLYTVWPRPELDLAGQVERFCRTRGERNGDFVLLRDGEGVLLGQAETFARTIGWDGGTMTVMGLAGVCVDPARKGQGAGRQVVARAFAEVESGRYPLCLFQTEVPGFYKRLGCRCVENDFYCLDGDQRIENPWWEPKVMIYPGDGAWPSGAIDLGGGAY